MKASELRKKTIEGLEDELQSLMKLSFSLRLKKAAGGSASLSLDRRALKKDIARVKLVLSEKGVSV